MRELQLKCSLFLSLMLLLCSNSWSNNEKEIIELVNQNKSQGLFTENQGQVFDQFNNERSDVLFSGESNGLIFHIRKGGISYQIHQEVFLCDEPLNANDPRNKDYSMGVKKVVSPDSVLIHRTDINWIGINEDFEVEKINASIEVKNFYLTNSPDGILGVKSYEAVLFKEIYDGIDLRWYFKNGCLEYDFIVRAGANVNQITWAIEGANKIEINKQNQLVMQSALGEIREEAPIAFQGGKEVKVKWELDRNVVRFKLSNYSISEALIIDPLVRIWGTYYGGTGYEDVTCAEIDASSNIYLVGVTQSTTLIATSGSHQTGLAGFEDGYVAKFDNTGNRIWSTYYGGPNSDVLIDCDVDANSNLYFTGYTQSSSGIASSGAFQDTLNGYNNAFLVKLNSNGIRQWATYFGNNDEYGLTCVVDNASNVYLSGVTYSSTGLATIGAHQMSNAGGSCGGGWFFYPCPDAFVAKFDANGNRLFSTYVGGNGHEEINGADVDASDNHYIGGTTTANNNIATTFSHQSTIQGYSDGFIMKFNSGGIQQYGTYFGGIYEDYIYALQVDNLSNVYVAGSTNSPNGISTLGTFKTSSTGWDDGFAAKFNSVGIQQWGSYIGEFFTYAYDITIDDSLNMYVCGTTPSTTFIATNDAYQDTLMGGEDAFLIQFNSIGQRKWGTYYGGASADAGLACMAQADKVYLAGRTNSSGQGLSTANTHQQSNSGALDGFLVQFERCKIRSSNLSVTSCGDYQSPGGLSFNATGIYTDTIDSDIGCDSVLVINYTLKPLAIDSQPSDITVGVGDDAAFKVHSSDTSITYRWQTNVGFGWQSLFNAGQFGGVDSPNLSVLNARMSNSYALFRCIIKRGDCRDTSQTVELRVKDFTGLDLSENKGGIHLSPNPTEGMVFLEFEADMGTLNVEVFNNLNQKTSEYSVLGEGKKEINISGKPGIYFLKTTDQFGNQEVFKIIKN